MAEAARGHDRNPADIEVTSVGSFDPTVIDAYAKQGVDRVLVSPPTGDLDALRPVLMRFRDDVMLRHSA